MTDATQPNARTRLGAAGVAVTLAATLTNAVAYLVPVLGARRLSPGDLSALATALALTAIASVPGLGLQIAVAVRWARYGRVPTRRVTIATAALSSGVLLAAAPLLTTVLHLPAQIPVPLAVMTGAVVLAGRWLGELQGEQRFLRLAAGMIILAVGRYGGIIVGLIAGVGLIGSLTVAALVAALMLPLLVRISRPATVDDGPASTRPTGGEPDVVRHEPVGPGPVCAGAVLRARHVCTASSATLAMLVVSYADLLLARQLLPAAESGAYAVGAVLTKGALWAPQVVTVLVLPRLAVGDRRARNGALGLIGACGLVLVVGSALAGGLAFRLAGGADYTWLGASAPFFAATGALYALVFMLVNAQVAAGARWPSAPLWAATAGLVLGVFLFATPSFAGVLYSALIAAAAAAIALAVIVYWPRRESRPR